MMSDREYLARTLSTASQQKGCLLYLEIPRTNWVKVYVINVTEKRRDTNTSKKKGKKKRKFSNLSKNLFYSAF